MKICDNGSRVYSFEKKTKGIKQIIIFFYPRESKSRKKKKTYDPLPYKCLGKCLEWDVKEFWLMGSRFKMSVWECDYDCFLKYFLLVNVSK